MKQSHNQIQFRQIRFRKTRFWNDTRYGFTLVEMLVSVSLVLIIMLLLANVFGLAANTVEKQKGTAENDQQARTFVTIVKGDLCSRSFRFVYPFSENAPAVDAALVSDVTKMRKGYFSISENNPDDHTDDVLSLTVDYSAATPHSCVDNNQSPVYGQSTVLTDGTAAANAAPGAYLRANRNQPEFDDGNPVTNDQARSRYAEVIYFLRNGNLYRRVLLIREPAVETSDPDFGSPNYLLNNEINGDYPGMSGTEYAPLGGDGTGPDLGTGEFNRDLDFSAIYNFNATTPQPVILAAEPGVSATPAYAAFNNIYRDPNSAFTGTEIEIPIQNLTPSGQGFVHASLGIPHFRFGHDMTDGRGRAREYLQAYTYPDPGPNNANSGEFFGRFLLQETADSGFNYPGAPDVNSRNPYSLVDYPNHSVDANTQLITPYHNETFRRGDDILLSGVLEFDVKVWDEVRREFVDLGNNDGGQYDISNNNNTNYGNCYDTWHPSLATPPPYRPTSVGADGEPGDAGVDGDDGGDDDDDGKKGKNKVKICHNGKTLEVNESAVKAHLAHGDTLGECDDDDTGIGWPGTDDEEASRLKAIQIIVRFVDPQSSLVRQVTFIESLVD